MRDPVAVFAPFGLVELSSSGVILDACEIFMRWFFLFDPVVVGSRLADVFGVDDSESERSQLLLAASVSFADSSSPRALAEVLADAARRSFRAGWSSVHLFEPDGVVLVGGQNPLAQLWPSQAPPTGARTMQLGRILTITAWSRNVFAEYSGERTQLLGMAGMNS